MKRKIRYGIALLLGVFWLATFNQFTFATLIKGPYLQAVTANSVCVLVESDLDAANPVEVEYGTTTNYGSSAFTDHVQKTDTTPVTYVHTVKLTGLQPNMNYHYRVYENGIVGPDHTFGTAVSPGTGFRFAWMGDCRDDSSIAPADKYKVHDAIALAINTARPRFSLYGGDLCQNSTYDSFKNEFFRPNELALSANVPFFNTVGNHETWGTNTKAFTEDTSASGDQGYYSFDYGDLHVLVLNFQDPGWKSIPTNPQADAQYNFAKADLQNTTKRWKIVVCHCPAYCSGGDGSDTSLQKLTTDIFEPNGVNLVLSGHSHFYQHNLLNRIHHVIIGGGGAPLHPASSASYTLRAISDYCYGIFDVTPNTLNLAVYNDHGSLLDSLDLTYGTKGEWSMEGDAKDQSIFKSDGTPNNVTFATGVIGRAAKFNGSNSYITIPYPAYKNFNNMNAFTLSAWIYPTSLSNANVIISKVNTNRDFVFQLMANGKMDAYFAIDSSYYHCISDNPVPLNKWSHVAAVWTGSKWQLYVNGSLVKEASYPGYAPQWTSTDMEIGSMLQAYPFNGKLDEVKVFNYALGPDDMNRLYKTPLPKGIWMFEGNANDQTANNANGTLIGGVTYVTGNSGKGGQQIKLDGTGYVEIANNTAFNNMKSFTLSAWISPTSFDEYNGIISKVDPNRDFNLQLYKGQINAHFAHYDQYYQCFGNGQVYMNYYWTHVAAVWTGSEWELYQNGGFQKKVTYNDVAPPDWTGRYMGIGSMDQSYYFKGFLDDVKVFEGRLTPKQIQAEANAFSAAP